MQSSELIHLNNGFDLPSIGFGTYPYKEPLLEVIPAALACGYRLIDTSDNYGNEEYVGQGLAKAGLGYEDLVLVAKFSQPMRTHELAACFAESEAKLRRSIDLYLLHWPYPSLWKKQWRRMEELYLQGRCKAIGVCNFERDKLEELLSFCEVPPAVNQFESHPLFQQHELVDLCRERGIYTMSYSPVARMNPDLMGNEVLKSIAKHYGKAVTQIILRWNIQHKQIPIPASGTAAHVEANFDVFDFYLSDDEMNAIDGLECGKRIRYDPKKRFGIKQKVKFALERTRA